MILLAQTKEEIRAMRKAEYPYCLGRGDWSGKHSRHCNTCIRRFRSETVEKMKLTRKESARLKVVR